MSVGPIFTSMELEEQEIADAFTLWLAGIATMKNGREIIWETDSACEITIEFINGPKSVIVREYFKDGVAYVESRYLDGKMINSVIHLA